MQAHRVAEPTGRGVELGPPAVAVAAPAVERRALIVGNPNVGKTALFNRLTGQHAPVGNYPGVTVEQREGTLSFDRTLPDGPGSCLVVDGPGTCSLNARSVDERATLSAVLGFGGEPTPDLVVAVVDSGQLVRGLYLVLELRELGIPVVVALNMIDEVRTNPPRAAAVAAFLRVPCVATSGRTGLGIAELRRNIALALGTPPTTLPALEYPAALERDVQRVREALPPSWRSTPERERALALWALGSVGLEDERGSIDRALGECCRAVHRDAGDRDIDREIVEVRYRFLDRYARACYLRPSLPPAQRTASQRVDRVLLHPVSGLLCLVGVVLLMFEALFAWSEPGMKLVERGVTSLQAFTVHALPPSLWRDALAEGVIAGVGNVVVFLPQILLLFLFIALLEDSGYMARVALLMDRVMRGLGLPGRAFVPMLSAYACAVPAILATRIMERRRDRLLTMSVIPLMTCSARLPVYTLIVGALFPARKLLGWIPIQALVMVAMYVLSVCAALTIAWFLGRTVIRGQHLPLIAELPPYRAPNPKTTLRLMFSRCHEFLKGARTVILLCTVLLWALLAFPRHTSQPVVAAPSVVAAAEASSVGRSRQAAQVERSYAGRLGRMLEPALRPLGFDWKIGVGLIGAFAGRETFVSTMALVHGVGGSGEAVPLRERMRTALGPDGKPLYRPLVGLSLLIFFGFACQCTGTLAVVRRETGGLRWPAFVFSYTLALAYILSFAVYQGGRLLGF
jgi:ferrous iron transport protein B